MTQTGWHQLTPERKVPLRQKSWAGLIRVLALEGIGPTLELLNTQSRGLPKPTESEILVLGPRHLHLYEALQGLLTETPS